MIDCVLAIDIGTQSIKAGIVDKHLNVLERVQQSVSVKITHGNHVEMDADELWSNLVEACNKLELRSRVSAMVLSTLCPSLVPLSGEGVPLHPMILHQDRRSGKQAEWAMNQVGEEQFLAIAGNLPVPGGISLTSILWIKEQYPEIYGRADVCFGHAATLILNRLTGKFLIDPSNASFTGLYDTVGYSDWHHGLCSLLGIDVEKLPLVQNSNTVAGNLIENTANELGIDPDIPVVMGANDTTSACVGAGVTEPGSLLNTSGTVDILVLCLDKPLVSKNHLLRTHAIPGKWLAMRTVSAGGGSLEWFRSNFCKELDKDDFYSRYLKEVLVKCPPPRASFLPFLGGNRHDIQHVTASFTNLSLETTREDMLIALLCGIVDFQFEILQKWEKQVELKRIIKHVGGGARSTYTAFKQSMLDGFQLEKKGETTLVGAAGLAIDTLGK